MGKRRQTDGFVCDGREQKDGKALVRGFAAVWWDAFRWHDSKN